MSAAAQARALLRLVGVKRDQDDSGKGADSHRGLVAALRVVIVFNTPAGTALAISKVTPFLFAGIMSAWTGAYGARQKKKGERTAAGTTQIPEPIQVRSASPEVPRATAWRGRSP